MEMILQTLFSAVVNVIVFAFIPVMWWLARHRKEENLFKFLGLKKPELAVKWYWAAVFAVVYLFFYNFDFISVISNLTGWNPNETTELLNSSDNVTDNVYAGLGFAAVIPALIDDFIANGVAEEILFRGFLSKRFAHHFGTNAGIVIQGVCFGLMHNTLYLLAGINVGLPFHIWMFIFTGGMGTLLAVLDEKIFKGSVIPSILVHGANNYVSSMAIAFGIKLFI